MSVMALVPIKGCNAGKGRLATHLRPLDRARLIEFMLADVLAALRKTDKFAEIRIVTQEARLVADGCVGTIDRGTDLNTALLLGAKDCEGCGATSILIMPADLPAADPEDIKRVLGAARSYGVVIVPDRTGVGTNAMAITPPANFTPQFGQNSCLRHRAAAVASNHSVCELQLSSLAHDIDLPEDLLWLMAWNPRRYGFLRNALREAQ